MKTILFSALAATVFLGTPALADYPSQPVTAVVGFPAGGNADMVMRQLAEGMRDKFPEGMVVANKAGAGGTVAVSSVVTGKPDGYTFVIAPNSNLTIGPLMTPSLPYKTPDDFQVVIHLVSFSSLVVVPGNSPFKTAKDFVSAAQSKPGELSIGYPGTATLGHMNAEQIKRVANVKMLGVPFSGWGQGAPQLLGGHVDAMVAQPGETMPMLEAGTLRALGSLSAARQPSLPDVPTWAEQGFDVGLSARYMLVVPAGTPAQAVKYIHDAAKSAMEAPAFQDMMRDRGIIVEYMDGASATKTLWNEYKQYQKLLADIGVLKQ